MTKGIVVVGGQFGSEAKGRICEWLCRTELADSTGLAVRVGGPNAGHTAFGDDGHEFKFRHVPVASVTHPSAHWALAAGSEVDSLVLALEDSWLDDHGIDNSRFKGVDRQATVLQERHMTSERVDGLTERIGSTGKGIGSARAERIMREAGLWGGETDVADLIRIGGYPWVMIEGTQGYGLGLHAGYYPYCTSGDCRAIDFLAQTGVSPWEFELLDIWVVVRTYPIRVAGNSGPLGGEVTWDQLGVEPERTTVTNKVRRVGTWDTSLVKDALTANGHTRGSGRYHGVRVRCALTFLDYVDPGCAGKTTWDDLNSEAKDWVRQAESDLGIPIEYLGTGPRTCIDRRI